MHPFKDWHKGIQQGIYHNHELYAHFQSDFLKGQLKAYETAYEQAERGVSVCLTVSRTHYSIGFRLRSFSHAINNEPLPVE